MWGLLPTAVLCGVSLCAFGQPGIGQNGVVNTASRIPPTLPGGALARGSRFTISGVRFEEGHTTVTLAQKEDSTPVRLIQVSGKRIEAIVPAAAALGPSSLIVSVSGLKSKPFPIEIAAFNPGIYSVFGEGWGPGRIMNLDAAGEGSPNTEENPARPGQTISLLVTGMGAETGATVNIGGRAGRTAGGRKNGQTRRAVAGGCRAARCSARVLRAGVSGSDTEAREQRGYHGGERHEGLMRFGAGSSAHGESDRPGLFRSNQPEVAARWSGRSNLRWRVRHFCGEEQSPPADLG